MSQRGNVAKTTLDDLDRGIIRILQRDGRTPNTDVARALDVTETTIRNRVTRLLDDGLIEIVAVPTPKAVGLTMSAIIRSIRRTGADQSHHRQTGRLPRGAVRRSLHGTLRHHDRSFFLRPRTSSPLRD